MNHQNIVVETRDRVGLIRLNRPKALNALNDALMDELGAALLQEHLEDHPEASLADVTDPASLRRVAERFDTLVLHHAAEGRLVVGVGRGEDGAGVPVPEAAGQ